MAMWVKQLTRENTLLDRSFRTLAYATSLREIGRASISKSPVVGFGRVTSLYYDPLDYKKQQRIILREFRGKRIATMSAAIVRFLEEGYRWAKIVKRQKPSRKTFVQCIRTFMHHHAHSRGAIVYGYWGEPAITAELKRKLSKKVSAKSLDSVVSILSTPHSAVSPLQELHHSSKKLVEKRLRILKRLRLSPREKELAKILSWFTFFYEMGERVSSFMYVVLLQRLRQLIPKRIFAELEWYDPDVLLHYFVGRKLSEEELARRKDCYILRIQRGKLQVVSGERARTLFHHSFEERGIQKADFLRGTVACQGKARGVVKIVVTQVDQKKMRKGNILVSPMTTPSLMVAIRKAGAIVTDEGGMTAHAAIVSRELNIPCIVGTKIATEVFKDGDRVEVDAERGIVKKI